MEDSRIVALYWRRDEAAIAETQKKYGRYCHAIAYGILRSDEDAEEAVNDTYVGAWNAMPPHRPAVLSTFLGKITRRLSLKRWRARDAQKRGGGELPLALEELGQCIPAPGRIDEGLETEALAAVISELLGTLRTEDRRIFLRRYWYFDSVRDIASRFDVSESKVKMSLKRTRDRLRRRLQEEGIAV